MDAGSLIESDDLLVESDDISDMEPASCSLWKTFFRMVVLE